jgi:hypothetical protein
LFLYQGCRSHLSHSSPQIHTSARIVEFMRQAPSTAEITIAVGLLSLLKDPWMQAIGIC